MKNSIKSGYVRNFLMMAASMLLLALSLQATPVFAHSYKVGDLEIIHPWTRATPNGAKVAGGYVKIINHGKSDDRLVSASSELSNRTEIHSMSVIDGVMKMRHEPDGIEIPAGATVELKPGGWHIMFMDLTKNLEKGQKVNGQLRFAKAGPVDVYFYVDALGIKAPSHH